MCVLGIMTGTYLQVLCLRKEREMKYKVKHKPGISPRGEEQGE